MNGKRRITESPEGAPGCIGITEKYIYLLLAEFSVRTVNYGPSFMAQARSARAINRWKKTRIPNLQYGPTKRG